MNHDRASAELNTDTEDDVDGTKSVHPGNSCDGPEVSAVQHHKLNKLICEHQKRLRQKKGLLTDNRAASTIFDLEGTSTRYAMPLSKSVISST